MLGHKTAFFSFAATLYLSLAPHGVATAQAEDIAITDERVLARAERLVDGSEICSEGSGDYRLAVSSTGSADDFYFRLDNLSGAPIFVYLLRDGETYWTDYPNVQVLFRTAESDVWRAPVMNPGEFDFTGVERISIEPGTNIVFGAPVSRYLPGGSKTVKLQLKFHTSPDDTDSSICVSSTPFRVQLPNRDDAAFHRGEGFGRGPLGRVRNGREP
jgi:hypothetical protein